MQSHKEQGSKTQIKRDPPVEARLNFRILYATLAISLASRQWVGRNISIRIEGFVEPSQKWMQYQN